MNAPECLALEIIESMCLWTATMSASSAANQTVYLSYFYLAIFKLKRKMTIRCGQSLQTHMGGFLGQTRILQR